MGPYSNNNSLLSAIRLFSLERRKYQCYGVLYNAKSPLKLRFNKEKRVLRDSLINLLTDERPIILYDDPIG